MKSAANRYNYRNENLYAGLLAIVFFSTCGLKLTDRLPAPPVQVLVPKEKKKQKEDELTQEDSTLFVLATSDLSKWQRMQIAVAQRNMIIEWARERFAPDTLQIALH